MTNIPISVKALDWLIIFFFAFICIFPSFRVLLVGAGEMSGLKATVITALPDIFLGIILLWAGILYIKNPFKLKLFDYMVIGYIVLNVLIGVILGKDLKIAAYGFRLTYLPVLFYFVGRLYSQRDFYHTASLVKRVFYCFFGLGLAGLILYFFFPGFEKSLIEETGYRQGEYFIPRMTSLVLTPILFATMMAIALLYFYCRILKSIRWVELAVMVVLSTCLFLTVSRGAILAFILIFILLSAVGRKWKPPSAQTIIIGLVILILGLILPVDGNIFLWIFKSTSQTVTMGQTLETGEHISRVELWKQSWADLWERPWGYGLGRAGATAVRFLKDTPETAAIYTTDGWYLKTACETGIFGLLSYLVLASTFLIRGLKLFLTNYNYIFTFIIGMFLMVNIQNLASNVLDFSPYISLFWLLIGIGQNILLAHDKA